MRHDSEVSGALRPSGISRSVAAQKHREESATAFVLVLTALVACTVMWFALGGA